MQLPAGSPPTRPIEGDGGGGKSTVLPSACGRCVSSVEQSSLRENKAVCVSLLSSVPSARSKTLKNLSVELWNMRYISYQK